MRSQNFTGNLTNLGNMNNTITSHNSSNINNNENQRGRIFGKDITNQVKSLEQQSVKINFTRNQPFMNKQGSNLPNQQNVAFATIDPVPLVTNSLINPPNSKKNLQVQAGGVKNSNANSNYLRNLRGRSKIQSMDDSLLLFKNNVQNNTLREVQIFQNGQSQISRPIQANAIQKGFNPNLKNLNFKNFKIKENLIDSNVHMKEINTDSEEEKTPRKRKSPTEYYNPHPHLEYIDEIYHNLLQEELGALITADYLTYQTEITERMRVILIEWIMDVVIKFKLRQDTYFLTVNLIDRYLSIKIVTRTRLQLLGATCLFIACKYEEIYFPEIRDIIYISDKAYTDKEILEMESEILQTLEFNILAVYPKRFLEIMTIKLSLGNFDFHFCNLMFELSTFDYKMVRFSPSLVACTCLYIAFKIKKLPTSECNQILMKFALSESRKDSFDEETFEKKIKECAQCVCFLLDNIDLPYFRKIKEKYSRREYNEVANFKIFNTNN